MLENLEYLLILPLRGGSVRKTILIVSLCSFLLFMFLSYYFTLWMGERDKRLAESKEEKYPVVQQKNLIDTNTRMVYQYFYTADRVTKEKTEAAPVFLQGLDMEQLKSVYHGWRVVYFSPETVILRCTIEGLSSETYILGEKDGFLAVYYEDAQQMIHLKEKINLPLAALPKEEAQRLREGIRVNGEENLAKILSDINS